MNKLHTLLTASIFCILTQSICPMEESIQETLDRTDRAIESFFRDPSQQSLEKAQKLIATIEEEQKKYFHQTSSIRTNFQNMIINNIEQKIALLAQTNKHHTRPEHATPEAMMTAREAAVKMLNNDNIK